MIRIDGPNRRALRPTDRDDAAPHSGRAREAHPGPAAGVLDELSSIHDMRIGGTEFVVSTCLGYGADATTVPAVNTEPDRIFCGIVAGEIPSTTIARTERAIAFMDINPATPGHALVILRSHATDLLDTTADDLAACILLAQLIARRAKDRLGADGVNLLNCSGEAAWQTVFHFHIHSILRFKDEPGKDRIGLPWGTVPSNLDEIKRIGNLLS